MRTEVAGLLAAAIEAARRYDREDLIQRLEGERAQLDRPRCTVLVIGEFKQGKSSLINALLNARTCAADADLATAVATTVGYGRQLRAFAIPADGAQADRSVPLSELETIDTGALEIFLPRELLREGLVLVDTPGVGGGLASAHAARTLRALTMADVLLFVSDAAAEYTAPELDFLGQAAQLCPTVICALTKIDFYPQWRRILTADRKHLADAGFEYEILPLSAPLRHEGLRTLDRELLRESGYPALATRLRQAAGSTADNAAAGAAACVVSALSQLTARLATEYDALTNPGDLTDRRSQYAQARSRAERLRSGASRWQQVLTDRSVDLAASVDSDLSVRLRTVRKEAAARIAETDPVKAWAELEPWLHQRTNEALVQHYRALREQVDQLADTVAEQFGLGAWELRIDVDIPMPGEAAKEVRVGATATGRSSRFEVGLLAARGGSTGAILTHAAGLVLGLALPVTLPATAVLATALAGKTWRTARASQLRMLRAEAERVVIAYLDEVDTLTRQESRTTARVIPRQLREVFAARAAELYASTAQNLEALSRGLEDADEGQRERSTRIAGELQTLRRLSAEAEAALAQLLSPVPSR